MSTNTKISNDKGLKKYFRFSGLISFFVVMSLIAALLYLFAESLIQSAIENGGTAMVGTEVNVASVELQYSPLKLTVNGLEVTDSELPSHNSFSFKKATASIDFWQYLLGKTIIEQLNVEQFELMTKRERVGEVYVQNETDDKKSTENSLLPSMDLKLPEVKDLLKDSNLLTVKEAQRLENIYNEERKALTALKEKLPSKAKLAVYQVKIKSIGKMKVKSLADFERVKAEFEGVKKEFYADRQIVINAQNQLEKSKARLTKQVAILKNAPKSDWQAIEKKYQLESVNTEDFAHILFGEQARGYYQKIDSLYQFVTPMMTSDSDEKASNRRDRELESIGNNSGRFIHFDDNAPLPAFLIKQMKISMILDQGSFEVVGKELTHQHWFRNKASELSVNSTNLANSGELQFIAQLDLNKNGDLHGQGQWFVNKLLIGATSLINTKALLLALDKAELSGEGRFNVKRNKTSTNHISSNNHFVLTQTNYKGNADTKFAKILLDAFQSLDEFTIDIDANGDLEHPELSISSSLDDAVKSAFKQQIAKKLAGFEQQLNNGLNDKLSESLKNNESSAAELINFEALLGDRDKALDQLKNSDVVKQQKKKLQDKAKDKLKNKLSDLFG